MNLPSASTVATDRSGRVLVLAGRLVRFTPRGALDRSFGRGGVAELPPAGRSSFTALTIQRDGRLLIAGSAALRSGYSHFAVARYTRSGVLDRTFGNGGVVETPAPYSLGIATAASVNAVAQQPDGAIIAAGELTGSPAEALVSDLLLARYDSRGRLDPQFGQAGFVRTDLATRDLPVQLLPQRDGKVLLGGRSARCHDGANENCDRVNCLSTDLICSGTLLRYLPSGALDTTFGDPQSPGRLMLPRFYLGTSIVQQQSGRLLLLSGGEFESSTASTSIIVRSQRARADTNGRLDKHFGIRPLSGALRELEIGKAVPQPDGRVLLLDGSGYVGRLNASATPDISFGRRGLVKITRPHRQIGLADMARAPDGKIILAGFQATESGSQIRLLLLRLRGR
jgi:uncharacterized delta-60 repeat protein